MKIKIIGFNKPMKQYKGYKNLFYVGYENVMK
jgi:hypothetical protein